MRSCLLLALVLVALFAARPARADVKDFTVALFPGYALSHVDGRAADGGGVGAEIGVGMSRSLSLKASLVTSFYPVDRTATRAAGTIGEMAGLLGLNYARNVLRLVPSFDAGLGLVVVRGSPRFGNRTAVTPSRSAFAFGFGFAVDYLLTRQLELGLMLRLFLAPGELERMPAHLFVGPRLTFRLRH